MISTSNIGANPTPPKKPHERYFDDVTLGDEGTTPEVTVTKEMIRAYADLTGDHTPVHPGNRRQPFPGRPAYVALPRGDGCRCHQGRTTEGRRCWPRPRPFQGGTVRLFPATEHGQARPLYRSQGQARACDDARAGQNRRRVRRELSTRRADKARARPCRVVKTQSAPHLLLSLRLWPYRTGFLQGRLRPDRGRQIRCDGTGRQSWRGT